MLNHEWWFTNKKQPCFDNIHAIQKANLNVIFNLLVICKRFSTFLIKDHAHICITCITYIAYKQFYHDLAL